MSHITSVVEKVWPFRLLTGGEARLSEEPPLLKMSAVVKEGETMPLSMEEAYACIAGLEADALAVSEPRAPFASSSVSTAASTAAAGEVEASTVRDSRARELLSSVAVSLPTAQKESLTPSQKRLRARESTTTAAAAPKPKKKRIRREKRELDYLRGMVGKLEQQMAELKAQASDDNALAVNVSSKASGGMTDAAGSACQSESPTCSSTWQGIAQRQLQARTLSEEQNRKLRRSLEGQLQLASKLEGLLNKRPLDEATAVLAEEASGTSVQKKAAPQTDDDIFAEQLAHVQRAPLDVDHLFQGSEGVGYIEPFSNIFVKNDGSKDTGVVFEIKNYDILPFNLNVTATAVWRTLAIEGVRKHAHSVELRTCTDNLIAQSFSIRDQVGAFAVKMQCKQTIRRCVETNRVVIVAKSVMEPSELNDTKFYGVESHQIVWLVLDQIDPTSLCAGSAEGGGGLVSSLMASTAIRVYSQTTMELKPGLVDQDLAAGTLTDFVIKLHDTAVTVCRNMVQDCLVREDMNANFWLDGLAL